MNRSKNVTSGVIVGGANYVLGIVCPFLIRTIMIRYLGNEYLGLNSLFTSILQVLSLSELGFGVAIAYLLYEPLAKEDFLRINHILNFYKLVYIVIGFAIIGISIVLTFFLPSLVSGEVPSDINLYILFWIYVINTSLSYFLFAYKRILLSANQRYDTEMVIAMIASIARYLIQIVGLIIFHNYYLYAIALPVGTIIDNVVCALVVNKLYPWCNPSGRLDRSEIIDVIKNTGGAFCSKIGSTVYLSVDSIVISAFLGLFVLGTYNNYYYIVSMFIMFLAVVHNSIRPVIGNYWVVESREKNWSLFKRVNLGYMLFVTIICACLLPLLQKFEILWAGKNNVLDADIVILFVIYFWVGRLTAIPSLYLEATGTLWQGKLVPLISAGVNLGLNIVLVKTIGLTGVLISSIVAAGIITIPGYMGVLKRTIFREYRYIRYTALFIAHMLVNVTCVCAVTRYLDFILNLNNTWTNFIIEGVLIFVVAMITILVLNLWNPEFRELLLYIKRKVRIK